MQRGSSIRGILLLAASLVLLQLNVWQVSAAGTLATKTPVVEVPILMYHYIENTNQKNKSLFIPPPIFEKQLQWLDDHGYQTVSLDEMVGLFHHEITLAKKPVVLTFDDGWQDAFTTVLPLLLKHKMIGNFYVISGFIGKPNFLTTDEIKTMAADGMSMQDHTVNHVDLDTVTPKEAKQQLEDSKMVIQLLTEVPVIHVAYPSGKYNPKVIAIAKALGYLTGVTTHPGIAKSTDNLLALPRIRMKAATKLGKLLKSA